MSARNAGNIAWALVGGAVMVASAARHAPVGFVLGAVVIAGAYWFAGGDGDRHRMYDDDQLEALAPARTAFDYDLDDWLGPLPPWSRAADGSLGNVVGVALAGARRGETVVVGFAPNPMFLMTATERGLVYTDDGGDSWRHVEPLVAT